MYSPGPFDITLSSSQQFLESVLPLTAHLHLADAAGVGGEGLHSIGKILVQSKINMNNLNIQSIDSIYVS